MTPRSTARRPLVALLVLAAAVALGAATCRPVQVPQPTGGFEPPDKLWLVTVLDGLTRPWDVDFLPVAPRTMVFTERGGDISVHRDGQKQLLYRPPDVHVQGEAGLLGLAVDPQWSTNRYVWACMTTTTDVRVLRLTTNAAFTAVVARTDVVTGIPRSGSIHFGCRVGVQPSTGAVFVTTGDTGIGTTPQNVNSLAGKTLRVDRNGNPFPGNPSLGGDQRVYTYGHRNPQGLAFRPGTSQVFTTEHGPNRDDEVNRLVGGGNYGWDPVPGYNQTVPMTDLVKFPTARTALWSSGAPPIAMSGATFVTGDRWKGWNGALAVANLRGAHLRIFFPDANGNAISATQSVMGEYGLRLRTVRQGPDGNLYITTDMGGGNDAIFKLVPGADD